MAKSPWWWWRATTTQLLLALLFAATISRGVQSKRCIVIFGDSLSDTGKLFDWTTRGVIKNDAGIAVPKAPEYWQGRFTNNPGNWADHITRLSNGEVAVFNYAYGGATACNFPDSFFQGLIPSLPEQVDQFLQQKQTDAAFQQSFNECTERTVVVWIGHNDLSAASRANFTGVEKVQAAVQDMGACIRNATETLLSAGEKAITVGNLIPVDLTPSSNTIPFLVAAVGALNTKLAADVALLKVSNPGSSIHLWNANDDMESFIGKYQDNGFTNSTGACLFFPGNTGILAGANPVSACTAPDQWIWYDYVHPSSRTHVAIAQSLSDSFVQDGVFAEPLFTPPASGSAPSPVTPTTPATSPQPGATPVPTSTTPGSSPAPLGQAPGGTVNSSSTLKSSASYSQASGLTAKLVCLSAALLTWPYLQRLW